MRSAILTLALLGLAPSAWAGVYNLSEQHPGNVGYGAARGFILRLRSAAEAPAGLPHPESFRAQVLRQVNDLERDRAGGVFSHLDRINLSACYLRLGRAGDALVLLLEEDNTMKNIAKNRNMHSSTRWQTSNQTGSNQNRQTHSEKYAH